MLLETQSLQRTLIYTVVEQKSKKKKTTQSVIDISESRT